MEKKCQANTNQKEAGETILVSGKTDFNIKSYYYR